MASEPIIEAIQVEARDYFVVIVDDVPVSVAEVSPAVHSTEGDLVRPTTLQFIWTPPSFRRRGHGALLVEHLLDQYSDLSHDGNLSEDGEALVDRHKLPVRERSIPQPYDAVAADDLGRRTYARVCAAL